MKRTAAALGLALGLCLATMSPSAAGIDDIVQVNKGTPYSWQGDQSPGTNANYFGGYLADTPDTPATPVGRCSKDRNSYCDVILFKINNPITAAEQAAGITKKTAKVRMAINWTATPVIFENAGVEPTDFDLLAFASNDLGDKGDEIADSAQGDTTNETVQFNIQTTASEPTVWVLLHVVYFAVPNANGYTGSVTFP